ncbi:gamma-glutamyltransferase family protein [Microbaculum marinum]|uniref:Gamma-glutamyltransferase family protein n=1 Tax=Microbaculum marinum TaxID=1764581 RepID=A0AAW9RP76_9HYPH
MIRDFQMPGRSAVYATGGLVAASHPLAASAALDVLRHGGNAVDAAITAAAVLPVAEPQMTSLGGDCFAIVAEPDGTLHGLNGSGRSPAALTPERVAEAGLDEMTAEHGYSVTVPGAVDAWSRLMDRFGTIGLDRALAPAIDLAERGVPVAPRVALDWAGEVDRLKADAGARRHYLRKDGSVPSVGDVMAYPALAATMRAIAADGPSAFYGGAIAEDLVAAIASHGGCMTPDDLTAVEASWVDPLLSGYRDISVGELPPSGQGIIALMMLAILDRFPLSGLDPAGPERLHLEIEAARLAYASRDRFLCDPASAEFPAGMLLEPAHIDALAARIDPQRRMADPGNIDPRDATDTVYLCVVDGNGMAVSFINSLFYSFGSAIAGTKSGVLLQNRGTGFVTTPGHPNRVGPRKRPMHTLIPGLLARDGLPTAVFGVMGGQYQACGHAHVVSNLVDFGMDPQAAIDAPRVFIEGPLTMLEHGIAEATAAGLAERGHQVARRQMPIGGGQMIYIDRDRGVLIGGSDPRKDGCAIGY